MRDLALQELARLVVRVVAVGLLTLPAVARAHQPPATSPPAEAEPLEELSLEQLMVLPVVSVSRAAEPRSEAPATVIVLSRRDLADRGYGDLSEMLDDLPGMDVVRPRGATLFKSYWRGFRNNVGSPYLLLVDGVVLNHLYFETDDVMAALPISDIERVEIVYGPASAVYGANAFSGVIQVITTLATPAAQSGGSLRVEAGEVQRRRADGTWRQNLGRFTLSLAARGADAELDPHGASGYAYTDPALLRDPRLWGGFVDDPGLAGQLSSPERHRGIDLRAVGPIAGGFDLEAAAQYFRTLTGYGYEYAFDASQPHAVWWRGDWNGYLRARKEAGSLVSTTLLGYRRSTVDDASTFLEGYEVGSGRSEQRLVDFSHWAADNHSWRLAEDLEWHGRADRLRLLAGASWEDRTLQKAYATAYGLSLVPAQLDPATYGFPSGSEVSGPPFNFVDDDLLGVYAEAKWRLREGPPAFWDQHLSLGVRYDHSGQYGPATTVRAGYVGTHGPWGFKALYGEGFQEPNPRVLYGGWRGSGSDPSLSPERSRTFEASLTHTRPRMAELVSLWQMDDYDTIVIFGASNDPGVQTPGAENLGHRRVRGLDAHWTAHIGATGPLDRLELWAYYSRLFTAQEERFDGAGLPLPEGRIGDLAANKAWAGVTAGRGAFTANLRGRWIGERPTVTTNPVRRVDAFATADLFLRFRLPWAGASIGLRANNLFDETYYEPGVREASAGATPGFFDAAGVWHGSGGFFDSLLPQPGRELSLVITLGD